MIQALTALILNWLELNDLIIVAPTITAANNSFKPAAEMIRAEPTLSADDDGLQYGDLQWYGANSDQLTVTIDQDGWVALPNARYPPPVELFPPQQFAEGEAYAD
ncbi:hypothetical protein U2P60_02710 [Brucella sp. H1_1004]|uniref:hypothetical protein n=1 Tax=Brucella sp. H1_1004 TaxID=3110109 RepID=UPI0039B65B7C